MNRNPGSSTMTVQTVTVVYELDEVGLTYADTDTGQRYFIDAESKIDFKPIVGQRLLATATGRGYIVSASLAPTA